MPPNAETIRYWSRVAGPSWVDLQPQLDAQIAGLGRACMQRAGVTPGDAVLDVGCGCGQTSIELARAVGASGRVLGIDVSPPMLARARERASGVPGRLHLVRADAQLPPLADGCFDVLHSRFGTMFFQDPETAFLRLHSALRPGARLALVCWRTPADNPWAREPLAAIADLIPLPPPPAPGAPGPFAFADGKWVHRLLERAGFEAIELERHDAATPIGGGLDIEGSIEFLLRMGPAAAAVREAGIDDLALIRTSLASLLRSHQTPRGVFMDASTWLVTARA